MLLKLFKSGMLVDDAITLDNLMFKLGQMRKIAKGLADRNTVENALKWLHEHDTNPICMFVDGYIHSIM